MAGMPYGLQAMLKDGHKHLTGLDEAVIKNVEACKQLSKITRTSLGPNGMNKMVINHLDKLFVTSDAAVIVRELEVAHPAAKLLVMAAQAQEQEIGDGTNLVVTFGGELLGNAEELIRDGLHPSEIIEGYEKAMEQALKWMEELIIPGSETLDVRDADAVAARIKGTLSSKQFGYEGILAKTCAQACIDVCPKNQLNFNVDNVRVAKIIGSSLHENEVVQGMVIRRDVEGTVKHVKDAKVAVFGCAVDTSSTETKGTVLISSGKELEDYSLGEEKKMEEYIKGIAETGAKVVVSGQSFGEMALHFIERYDLMAIKISSKFELRRFCRATNATGIIKLGRPGADELGYVSSIVLAQLTEQGELKVFTDPAASPTGFPFKVLELENDPSLTTLSDPEVYEARPRVCNLGYLRTPFVQTNGKIGYKCPSEPVADYVAKGGDEAATVGRKCLCNALCADAGFPQVRFINNPETGKKEAYVEKSLITMGDDVNLCASLMKKREDGTWGYTAADVIDYLYEDFSAQQEMTEALSLDSIAPPASVSNLEAAEYLLEAGNFELLPSYVPDEDNSTTNYSKTKKKNIYIVDSWITEHKHIESDKVKPVKWGYSSLEVAEDLLNEWNEFHKQLEGATEFDLLPAL